jgi:lipopolysaccharide biosynthesis glycosyltransferase
MNSRPGGTPAVCPLVLACDAAYIMPLATTLRSLAESRTTTLQTLETYVICSGVGNDLREKVAASLPAGAFDLKWVDIDVGRFDRFFTLPHLSKMTFARLLIPEIVPADVSRVLYLDVDLLILGDLGALLAMPLDGKAMGAVHDRGDAKMKRGDPDFHNLPRVQDYFNCGVLLIDLDRWRAEHVPEKALAFLEANPRTPFGDQDALNVAMDGRWKILDPKWNFQRHAVQSIGKMGAERPYIAHFVMAEKPWIARMLNLNAALYDAYRSRTAFGRTPRQRRADYMTVVKTRIKALVKRAIGRR